MQKNNLFLHHISSWSQSHILIGWEIPWSVYSRVLIIVVVLLLFCLVYTAFICSSTLHMLKALWSDHIQYLMLFRSTFPCFKHIIWHSILCSYANSITISTMSTVGWRSHSQAYQKLAENKPEKQEEGCGELFFEAGWTDSLLKLNISEWRACRRAIEEASLRE